MLLFLLTFLVHGLLTIQNVFFQFEEDEKTLENLVNVNWLIKSKGSQIAILAFGASDIRNSQYSLSCSISSTFPMCPQNDKPLRSVEKYISTWF